MMSLPLSQLEAGSMRELDKKRREMLRDAEKLARIGSFEWDVRNNEVTWSDGLYAIYGLSAGEFQATFAKFDTPRNRKRFERLFGLEDVGGETRS